MGVLFFPQGLLVHKLLPGSHHLHMDPESAPALISEVEKFLLTDPI